MPRIENKGNLKKNQKFWQEMTLQKYYAICPEIQLPRSVLLVFGKDMTRHLRI